MANIKNFSDNTLISGTGGDDSIRNWSGENVTIDGDAGNDSIDNGGSNVLINGGDGNDLIYNTGRGDYGRSDYATIYGGADNDSIRNYYSRVKIDGGAGNDSIYNSGASVSIDGGAGDDSITIDGKYALIKYTEGDGNDYIRGFDSYNKYSTLSIGDGYGTYYTETVGSDLVLTVGEGKITLAGTAKKSNLNILGREDFLTWRLNGTTATYGTSNNALITIRGVKSLSGISLSDNILTITNDALNQTDITISDGYYLYLKGVTAPDYTEAHWSGLTYKSASNTEGYVLDTVNNQIVYTPETAEKDLFTISGVKSTSGIVINDKTVTIPNSALNQETVTISNNNYTLALGNDVTKSTTTAAGWTLSGTTATYKTAAISAGYKVANNQISYVAASGSESVKVSGVKNTDGLSISKKTVTVTADALNQSDVTISNGYNLVLQGVAAPKYTNAHWSGTTYKSASNTEGYTLSDNKITYTAAIPETDLFTISGVKSTSGITISGKTVTVPNSALNQGTVTITGGYTLALADDVKKTSTTAAGWSINGSTAVYKNSGVVAGYKLANNQISYIAASGGETLITVEGVKSADGISLSGNTITIGAAALNQNTVTVSSGYNLSLASDAPTPQVTAAHWELNGSTATYKNNYTSAGYSVANNQIVYNSAVGGEDLITVDGVKSLDGIFRNGNTITVGAAALNQGIVTVNNGYTLTLANDATTPQITAAHWELNSTTATYKNTSTSAGYSVVNNQIVYNEANGGEDLITVNGVKSLDGISQSGSTITIANSSLNQSNVTISNGYTLNLQGVAAPKYTNAHFDGMTYKSTSNTAGYNLVDNQIVYTAAVAEKDLFTINGVKNTKDITVDGTTVKVPLSALNKSNVTISNNNYNLALADDVKPPETTEAGWTLNGTTAIYKNASTTAGYSLNANNQIVYTPTSGGEILITVKGVKSLDGLSLNGKVVTVKASSLNKSKVTISGDYKLALDDDEVPKPKTTKAWTFNKNDSVAIYKQTTTAGYTLASNGKSISYSIKSTKNLIKVNGVKSANGLKLNSRVVTVPKAALNQKTVTVSDGYTLKLGGGVATPKVASADWVHNGTTATYKSSSTSAGYSTSSDGKSITYSPATASSTLATIKGIKDNVNPMPKSKVITLTKANLSESKVTVSGSYEFKFASGNYNDTSIVGSKNKDSITSNGSNLSIKGGKGNDLISLSSDAKNNVIVYNSGDGNDTIYGLDDNDTLKIAKGTASVTTKGNDVIFIVGNGKITVKGGVGKTINYVDKNGENTYPKSKSVTLTEDYAKKTYTMGNELRTLDASAVQRDLEITGNKFANKITGSDQNDIIKGGGANDTLTGGKGSDVFVYAKGDGNDVITDYAEEDKISIASGTISTIKTSGNDVIFTVGTGKLTVKNAKSKVVTYIDAKGKTNYYPAPKDSVIINGVTVKILEEYESKTFDVGNVKNGNKVEMIDAALVSHDLKIIGNAQANVILGGFGDDTIIGGKNNDTLQGGDGSNVFVYKNGDGNDVINEYNIGDKISLASGAVSSSSVKGLDDVVLKVGSNKITLKNGVNKIVTVVDKNGNNRIIGGTKDDNIKGDKGADTLQGGKGNDSLWGNAGADTFIYSNGDGKDIIYGFDNTDMLQIMDVEAKNITGTVNTKGTEIYFKVGKTASAITLKDFGKTTSFNVNGDSYKISNKKLVPSS